MSTTFTQSSNESIWKINTVDNDAIEALDYLNNKENFRFFSEGLTELMCKYSYTGSIDDIDAKTAFIYSKLSSIGVSITKRTVKAWFSDKRRPAPVSNSRTIMFQICFALSVSIDDVRWFFSHVFFDRSFNCHTTKEAVYYYCFRNGLDYAHGNKLLETINTLSVTELPTDTNNVFTKDIQNQLDHFSSDEELIDFFRHNKNVFHSWNKTAKENIHMYLSQIQGKEADKICINSIKNRKSVSQKELAKCGLIIQEFLPPFHDYLSLKDIAYKNITSIDFMLDCIFNTTTRFKRTKTKEKVNLPLIVYTNFPSKKIFSDILLNIETSTSYDSIRKCLILLKFYHFWCNIKLNSKLIDKNSVFDVYIDETNHLLTSSGYEELFSGNPYDWLFLCCATSNEPLDYFREIIGDVSLKKG